jgi:subtilisin family serine protease
MKHFILSFVFALLFSVIGFAQKSKINFELAQKAKSTSNSMLDVYIKGDVSTIKQLVENNGGQFKYASGKIVVAKIKSNSISTIASNTKVIRMEAYTPHLKIMGDTALIQNNVVPVHAGTAPLTQNYKGTGVVVGIIDTGIDITHPDFKNSLGNTRIKYLWDQRDTAQANSPQPYNYGQEWDSTEIDNGSATSHDATYYYGHGTHITGIAAGNGLAMNKYEGIAPEADIIFVALDFNSTNPTLVTDAVNYIYEKAQAIGKPCVINSSFGDYYGSHDGNDLQAQTIKNLINLQPGRAFVAAAGNAGAIPFHLGYSVTNDTNFTFIKKPSSSTSIYIQLWADTTNFKNVDFSIGADLMTPSHSFRGRIPFSDITSNLGILKEDTLYNSGNRIGIIQSYGDVIGATYSMEFNIIPDSTSYYWRLITTGAGKFDTWNFDLIRNNLPSLATMPDSSYYKLPDTKQTIVSSFQCLDEVITVGNYVNRNSYINYNGVYTYDSNKIVSQLAPSSSKGPTRDGRIKPDIAATGEWVISCLSQPLRNDFISFAPTQIVAGAYHKRGDGTSASSPVVAGTAALYLQKNPTATAMQVKQAILACPKTDSLTGTNLPDNNWGYGKVDAFTTLTGCLVTAVEDMPPVKPELIIYPNPSANEVNFDLNFLQITPMDIAEIRIYNAVGKLVKSIKATKSIVSINNELAPGVYICELIINEKKQASEKLVILQHN